MRDEIAVLDGLMPNPNTGGQAGWLGTQRNVSGSGGANYSGGSNFYPGAPTMPSSEGLAGMEQDWMDSGDAGAEMPDSMEGYMAAFSASPYVVSGPGDRDASRATGYTGRSLAPQGGGWAGTTRSVSGSNSANYSGGSNFFPGSPTMPSSEGLASLERQFQGASRIQSVDEMYGAQSGYVTRNVSGSGGANYSGGSSFYPGSPTLPSSEGLAALHGFLSRGIDPAHAVMMVRSGRRPWHR